MVTHCPCGNESDMEWTGLCVDCHELSAARFPITLGHAIVRFVRRARVEGLVETVRTRVGYVRDLPAFDAALAELAAMAMGGPDA
jgi:hypothetical protein